LKQVPLYSFLFLTVCCPSLVFSQDKTTPEIDSLLNLIPAAADTQKCRLMLRAATRASKISQSLATNYSLQALEMARKYKSEKLMNDAYYKISLYIRLQGDFEKSLKYLDSSRVLTTRSGDQKGLSQVMNAYGSVYLDMENYTESIRFFIESVKIKEKLNFRDGLANSYLNLSSVYNRVNMLDKAKEYLMLGLKIKLEEKDFYGVAAASNSLGIMYNRQLNFKKAIEVYKNALKFSDTLNDKNLEGALKGNLSESYFALKDYQHAEKFGLEAYNLRLDYGDVSGAAYCASELSKIYLTKKNYATAIQYAEKCLELSEKSSYTEGKYYGYKNLAEANEAMGNSKAAYKFLRLSWDEYDSLQVNESQHTMAEVESKYQLEKKETENQLNKERLKNSDIELKKQNQLKIFFGAGFALFALLAIFIFRSYRLKKKSNELITIQKEEVFKQKSVIEEKQKEILDSIHYAQRIQRVLFANEKYIAKHLKKLNKKS
jgi:tetratricopeptide (TPR) repeat protein